MAAHSRSSFILKIPPAGALIALLVSLGLLATSPFALESLIATRAAFRRGRRTGGAARTVRARRARGRRRGCSQLWSNGRRCFVVRPRRYLNALIAGVEGSPSVRHADAHPDAPPRKPLLAHADLGRRCRCARPRRRPRYGRSRWIRPADRGLPSRSSPRCRASRCARWHRWCRRRCGGRMDRDRRSHTDLRARGSGRPTIEACCNGWRVRAAAAVVAVASPD